MYHKHPSQRLQELFRVKPYQGVAPERAKYLFIGLDANYKADLEADSTFRRIVEYHEDGVAFWRRHGVHHPFLLPEYQGDGKKFHQRFAKFGFTERQADLVSFVELVEWPTTGRSNLDVGDLNQAHLDQLDHWIWTGSSSYIFLPSGVAKILLQTERFPGISRKPIGHFGELKVLFKSPKKVVFQHLHFSNYGKFEQRLQQEAAQIRRLIPRGE